MSYAPTAATPGGYDYQQFIGDQPTPADASSTLKTIVDESLIPHSNDAPSYHESNEQTEQPSLARTETAGPAVPPKAAAGIANAPVLEVPQEAILERDVKRIPSPQEKAMYPLQGQDTTSSVGPTRQQAGLNSAADTEKQVYGTTVDSKDNKIDENSPSVQAGKAGAGKDPKADFIVVFSLPSRDASSAEWNSAEQEYGTLKNALSGAGFQIAARPGGKDRNERLVIVKAKDHIIRAEAQTEKLTDWLNSVKGAASRNNPHRPRNFEREPIRPAERVRLAHGILERALYSPNTDKPYPRLSSYFPPHDPDFNTQWLKNWSTASIVIPEDQLVQVRDQFGEGVALYFQFLRYYFVGLGIPSFIGLTTWLGGYHFSKVYSVLLVIWSVVFLEGWKLQERQISVRWGTYNTSKHGKVRLHFKAEETIQSAITGDPVPYSPWWRRELRVASTVAALFGFALVLGGLITMIFFGEVLINEVYKGPGKQLLSLVPLVFFAGFIPQVVSLGYKTANDLTQWENHPTEVAHERSLTLKMFALNAIVSYGTLTLTAYIYLPFASFVVPYITRIVRGSLSTETLAASSFNTNNNFIASSQRLTNTLFALMTTTQLVGAFTEVALPFIQRKIAEKRNEQTSPAPDNSSKNSGKNDIKPKDRNEQNWLERVRAEVELPTYNLFSDYAEMVIQFGHVVLFSTAWPLAPVAAFINNFFELRGDAFKLCINSRRPIPQRTESLGPWVEALSWITYLGALINASLVFLLRPSSSHITYASTKAVSTKVGQDLAGNQTSIGSNTNPHYVATRISQTQGDLPNIKNILLGALLCALASEHAFVLLRYAVAHLMDMLVWRGSVEELTLRRSEWLTKKDYVESRGVDAFEKEIEKLKNDKHNDSKTGTQSGGDIWSEEDSGVREEFAKKSQ